MTTRINDILTRARDTLADENGDRFSTTRLLRILDEGQKEIVRLANLLRSKASIAIIPGIAVYDLPSDCYKVIRVLYNDVVAELESHESMDLLTHRDRLSVIDTTGSWETATDLDVSKIIFDKLNPGTIKVYPIPESQESSDFTLEAATQVPEDASFDPINGIATSVTGYTLSSPYGICTDFSDDYDNTFVNVDPDVDGVYGVLVTFEEDSSTLIVYYLKRPEKVTATTDTLEIDQVWDTVLKYYVTGMALRDDRDTQNRIVGNEELALFAEGVKDAIRDSSNDFIATRTQNNSPYLGGFQ